ncbi:phage antirepressor KilAC domain-containing protein [Halomonas sp. M20]|uniref:phage antirepressor KilAC domain-containing protein n=1 Tax=Halomonas sp. M20 TaxID=2763264 RepID=UPI001D09E3AF|nr:phage antirepressor KilAC domain-containing protein [Halomonas sp. M20]
MKPQTYTIGEAAVLLNLGRNTLARLLRHAGILDRKNLPLGRYRNNTRLVVVATGTYHHPILGWTHYGRTELTDAGLDLIADLLGADIERLPIHRSMSSETHCASISGDEKRNMNQKAVKYSHSI